METININGFVIVIDYRCNTLLLLIIKTLFTLGLECEIYKNEMITAKDKRVIHASRSRTSRL